MSSHEDPLASVRPPTRLMITFAPITGRRLSWDPPAEGAIPLAGANGRTWTRRRYSTYSPDSANKAKGPARALARRRALRRPLTERDAKTSFTPSCLPRCTDSSSSTEAGNRRSTGRGSPRRSPSNCSLHGQRRSRPGNTCGFRRRASLTSRLRFSACRKRSSGTGDARHPSPRRDIPTSKTGLGA